MTNLPTTGPRKGRYEDVMGSTLRDHYRTALADGAFLDTKDPLAALDSLIKRNFQRLEELDTPDFRYRCLEQAQLVQQAMNGSDQQRANVPALMQRLVDMLDRGANEDRLVKTIGMQLDRLMRRIEAAQDYRLQKRMAVNKGDMRAALIAILDVIRSETTSAVFTRIAARVDRDVMDGVGATALKKLPRNVEAEVVESRTNESA